PEWIEEENVLAEAMLDDYESRQPTAPNGRALTEGQRKRTMNAHLEIRRSVYLGHVGTDDPPPKRPHGNDGIKPNGSELKKGICGSLLKRKGEKVAQGAMAIDDE
ncbi:hypothetical protein HDU93_008693, partial [Gonapodya sp. JEL0774]